MSTDIGLGGPVDAPAERHGQTHPQARATPGRHVDLDDELIDSLDGAFRRLRRSFVRPPHTSVPMPSVGRTVDLAKVFACEAVAELSRTGDPVTVKAVAAALDLEASTVSRLVGDAEAEGLLVRREDPADRRRTIVALTTLGRGVVLDAMTMRRFFSRTVLAGWERDDVETLARLMTALADTLNSQVEALTEQARQEFLVAASVEAAPDLVTPPRPTG